MLDRAERLELEVGDRVKLVGVGGRFGPGRPQEFRHSAEQSLRRAGAHQDRTVAAPDHRGGAESPRPRALRETARVVGRGSAGPRPAVRPDRTDAARGGSRRTQRRAEIHGGLGEIPRALPRCEFARASLDFRPGGRHGRFQREQACDDALHVAIHDDGRPAERDGGNGCRRIVPDAGQSPKALFGGRKAAAVLPENDVCAVVQVAGAGVVTETGPFLQDLFARRRASASTSGQSLRKRA